MNSLRKETDSLSELNVTAAALLEVIDIDRPAARVRLAAKRT
jgi:hypothetical protein